MKDLATARCIVNVKQFAPRDQRELHRTDESGIPGRVGYVSSIDLELYGSSI